MEKKQFRTLIILGAVLILLLAGFFIGKGLNKAQSKKEEASEAAQKIDFCTVSTDKVDKFSYLISGNKINYEKKKDIWYACSENSTQSVSVNASNVESALTDVSGATASEIITGKDVDLDAFGLNSPTDIVTMSDTDGKSMTMTIGIQNTVTEKYYMYLGDDKTKVYVISSSIPDAFGKSVEEMSEDTSSSGYGGY